VRSVIGRAAREGILAGAVSDELVGTTFEPHARALSARRLWIAFAAEVHGTVVVDDGARRALVQGRKSLLPAGVVTAEGGFVAGDVVDVVTADGRTFARGRASVHAHQLVAAIGRRTADLPDDVKDEVVHRDDLVVFDDV
jgi:glutamate 5-kinase